jgi:hypothetical protein
MMENGLSKGKKIRMVGIKDIKKTPAIAASEFSADELGWGSVGRRGTAGRVLQHKLMTGQRLAVYTITVGITVWRDQCVWKPKEWRGHGRGRRRTAWGRWRTVGQANERFIVTVGGRVRIKIKYSKADTRVRQISFYGQFNGRESFIGESVRPGDDGQNINSGRERANDIDLGLREDRSTKERIGGDRGF